MNRLLVTSGATIEPVDGIRYLTNFSSGKTGATIADEFNSAGWEVIYLHGQNAALPNGTSIQKIPFSSFQDLRSTMHTVLSQVHFTAAIHSAAVSDFSIEKVISGGIEHTPGERGKLSSGNDLNVTFKKNPKLLDVIKEFSINKKIFVVGFKLSLEKDRNIQKEIAEQAAANPNIDALVYNDMNDIQTNTHKATIYHNGFSNRVEKKTQLAQTLRTLLGEMT